MTTEQVEKNEKAAETCIRLCYLCVKEWQKRSGRQYYDVKPAIAVCVVCKSGICEHHSLYGADTEIRRCSDRSECHALAPDQEEGEGD